MLARMSQDRPPEKSKDRPQPTPRGLALARLGRRECSRAEIETWLIRKGVTETEAHEVAAQLVREGLIDDARYARMMIRHQSLRGQGPRSIALKLRQKGVKLEVRQIQEQSEELGLTPELEAATQIVERRYPEAQEDRKVAARAFQALLRRGFSTDVARAAVFRKGRLNPR